MDSVGQASDRHLPAAVLIRIEIRSKEAERACLIAPALIAEELSHGANVWLVNTTTRFAHGRMKAPDDRNRGDFLLRRPRTSQGLRAPTGSLARGIYTKKIPQTRDLSKIRGETGFLAGKQAMIATVHELGTVRYGGKLPDIVPKRAKRLAAHIYGASAGRSFKGLRIVKLKKVGIPPRLGWVDWMTGAPSRKSLQTEVDDAGFRAIKRATRPNG